MKYCQKPGCGAYMSNSVWGDAFGQSRCGCGEFLEDYRDSLPASDCPSSDIQRVHEILSQTLTKLERYFSEDVRLTVIARHTKIPTAHMMVTRDSIEGLREGLTDLEAKPHIVVPGSG